MTHHVCDGGAEPDAQPIALVPVISEPLPAIATGAPVRLDPYKPAAMPRRPPPPPPVPAQARPHLVNFWPLV